MSKPPTDPKRRRKAKSSIGWREWVHVLEHGLPPIKAKVDTGAATSSLHAFDVELYDGDGEQEGEQWVRFNVHPLHKDDQTIIACDLPVHEFREVRSSNGQVSLRPVVAVRVQVAGRRFPVELTLANRDAMGFRMLLGREALRGRFVVDSGRSYIGGKPGDGTAKTPRRQETDQP